MPKIVDRDQRREEICGAAMRVLARGGPSALTLRSLARELNGSITLITHFFADRADLFDAVVEDLLADYTPPAQDDATDPMEQLRALVEWFLPATPDEAEREASRIALISARDQSKSIDHFYVAMEERARQLFSTALTPVVAREVLPQAVDTLRATVNGLVLSITEHPRHWTPERRHAVIDVVMLGIEALAATHPAPPR